MTGTLCVCRFAQEHQDPLSAQLAEPHDVHHGAVDRCGVELEVAGVNQCSQRGMQGDCAGVGDGVVDVNELRVDCAELDMIARLDHPQIGLPGQGVLLQLVLDDPQRQRGSEDGGIDGAENVGNRADVILVSVRKQDPADAVLVCLQVGDIGNDQVNARHIVIGKAETAVNDDQIIVVFDDGHVFADLAQPSERNDADLPGRFFFFGSSCHCKSFLLLLCTFHAQIPFAAG